MIFISGIEGHQLIFNPNFAIELAKIWQMLKFRVFTKILRLTQRLIDGFL